MTFTTVPTFADNTPLAATDLNKFLRNNENHLRFPPYASYESVSGDDFSTTSYTFEAVDSEKLNLTITTSGGDVVVGLMTVAYVNTNSAWIHLDVEVDGVRIGGDDGIIGCRSEKDLSPTTPNTIYPIAFQRRITGLSAGTHTFQLVWKRTAFTANLLTQDDTDGVKLKFWVGEIGTVGDANAGSGGGGGGGGGDPESYEEILTDTHSADLELLLMCDDGSGTTITDDSGGGNDGTASGTTWSSGNAPNGDDTLQGDAGDYMDFYYGGLHAALGLDGANPLGTVLLWIDMPTLAVADHGHHLTMYSGSSNAIWFKTIESGGDCYIQMRYRAGGTTKQISINLGATTDPSPGGELYALSFDKANDRVRGYRNGTKQGSDLTSLGTWGGSDFNTDRTCLFVLDIATGSTPSDCDVWGLAILSTELTDAEHSDLDDALAS